MGGLLIVNLNLDFNFQFLNNLSTATISVAKGCTVVMAIKSLCPYKIRFYDYEKSAINYTTYKLLTSSLKI